MKKGKQLPVTVEELLKKIGLGKPIQFLQMTTGSASINYYVKNKNGEFLVKVLKNNLAEKRLLYNMTSMSGEKFCPLFLFKKKLENQEVFVFKWVEGKNIFLDKLSVQMMNKLISSYLIFLEEINIKIKDLILPAVSLKEILDKINRPYWLMKKELFAIKNSLGFKPNLKVIHGDLNYKNLIFKDGKFQSFLDFQEFSWGCPTEDLMRLLITNAEQHSFFRNKFSVKFLKIMMKSCNFSKEEWLYGLNVFILKKYEKKLNKRTLSNRLSVFRCNFLYHKLRKMIHLFFDKEI